MERGLNLFRGGISLDELRGNCKRKAWYGLRWIDRSKKFESRFITFFTKESPSDEEIIERLNLGGYEIEEKEQKKIKSKALEVLLSEEPPKKISTSGDSYECTRCEFIDACHYGAHYGVIPDKNCRTCAHVTPLEDCSFRCEIKKKVLNLSEQVEGCNKHLYNPHLIPYELIAVENDGIIYRTITGEKYKNSDGGSFEKITG